MPKKLTVVRVRKHPDWPRDTTFRLFADGELVANIRIPDEIADEFERVFQRSERVPSTESYGGPNDVGELPSEHDLDFLNWVEG